MPETRNLCAQLPLDLHQRVCEAREQSGLTTAQYITNLLLEYYERSPSNTASCWDTAEVRTVSRRSCQRTRRR